MGCGASKVEDTTTATSKSCHQQLDNNGQPQRRCASITKNRDNDASSEDGGLSPADSPSTTPKANRWRSIAVADKAFRQVDAPSPRCLASPSRRHPTATTMPMDDCSPHTDNSPSTSIVCEGSQPFKQLLDPRRSAERREMHQHLYNTLYRPYVMGGTALPVDDDALTFGDDEHIFSANTTPTSTPARARSPSPSISIPTQLEELSREPSAAGHDSNGGPPHATASPHVTPPQPLTISNLHLLSTEDFTSPCVDIPTQPSVVFIEADDDALTAPHNDVEALPSATNSPPFPSSEGPRPQEEAESLEVPNIALPSMVPHGDYMMWDNIASLPPPSVVVQAEAEQEAKELQNGEQDIESLRYERTPVKRRQSVSVELSSLCVTAPRSPRSGGKLTPILVTEGRRFSTTNSSCGANEEICLPTVTCPLAGSSFEVKSQVSSRRQSSASFNNMGVLSNGLSSNNSTSFFSPMQRKPSSTQFSGTGGQLGSGVFSPPDSPRWSQQQYIFPLAFSGGGGLKPLKDVAPQPLSHNQQLAKRRVT